MSDNLELTVRARRGTRGVVQLDLDALADRLRPKLTDPTLTQWVETDASRPIAPAQTTGPHRYTIYVPNQGERSVVNIGQAATNRINDTGITGKTRSHVHFETVGDVKTFLGLGIGAHEHAITSAHDGKVPGTQSNGFSVVTQKNAFINAVEQITVVSDTKDVHIRASQKKITVQGTNDKVSIESGLGVNVAAKGTVKIAASQFVDPEHRGYEDAFEDMVGKAVSNDVTKYGVKLADLTRAVYAVVVSAQGIKKKAKDGKSGWENTNAWDKAKFLVDVGKIVSTVGRLTSEFLNEQGGKVGVTADTYLSTSGGVSASMWGGLSATLSSLVSASVLGGTAGVVGLAWASVWSGIGTSIKSLKDAGIEGEKGKCTVKAKREVSIDSTDSFVKVTGKKHVQVNSDKKAWVHGGEFLYATAGKGTGYGMSATSGWVFLGMHSNADDFEGAEYKKDRGIRVMSNKIEGVYKSGSWEVSDKAVIMQGKTLKLEAKGGNATIKGRKVLIG